MPIVSTSSGSLIRGSIGSLIITAGGEGQQIVRARTTNQKIHGKSTVGKSSHVLSGSSPPGTNSSIFFQLLDQQILALDALYDSLPD